MLLGRKYAVFCFLFPYIKLYIMMSSTASTVSFIQGVQEIWLVVVRIADYLPTYLLESLFFSFNNHSTLGLVLPAAVFKFQANQRHKTFS